jgi:hypothetical protein
MWEVTDTPAEVARKRFYAGHTEPLLMTCTRFWELADFLGGREAAADFCDRVDMEMTKLIRAHNQDQENLFRQNGIMDGVHGKYDDAIN